MHLPRQLRGGQAILIDWYAKIVQDRNEHTESNHFHRMAANLSARQYERSSRRFQGCYTYTSTTGYDTDLGCTSSTQSIWTNLLEWNYFSFPTTTIFRVSKLTNSLRDLLPDQSLRYISITTSTASEHRKRQTKRRNKIERRLK